MAELNVPSMVVEGVELDNLLKYFRYCGLKVHRITKHGFLNKHGYIYLVAEQSPADIIENHFDYANYTYDNLFVQNRLSKAARRWVSRKAGNTSDSTLLKNLLSTPEALELERIHSYTYVICSTERKYSSTYMEHVMDHAYDQIVRFPWVDRRKTISNDWYNVNGVLGVDIASNNYMIEPFQEITSCKAELDPRHLILLSAYVFERGFPAGIGLRGVTAHGVDFLTESFMEKTGIQIPKAHTRKPANNLAMYVYTGSVASRGYLPIKLKEVAANDRYQEINKLRSRVRLDKDYQRDQVLQTNLTVRNKIELSARILANRSKIIQGDPYAGIPIKLSADRKMLRTLTYPDDLEFDKSMLAPNTALTENIKQSLGKILQTLRNTKNHVIQERSKIFVKPSTPFVDMKTAIQLVQRFNLRTSVVVIS